MHMCMPMCMGMLGHSQSVGPHVPKLGCFKFSFRRGMYVLAHRAQRPFPGRSVNTVRTAVYPYSYKSTVVYSRSGTRTSHAVSITPACLHAGTGGCLRSILGTVRHLLTIFSFEKVSGFLGSSGQILHIRACIRGWAQLRKRAFKLAFFLTQLCSSPERCLCKQKLGTNLPIASADYR
eukprot:COSAG01_NODE_2148_length_8299_cov_283.948177_4_plen_178_part_00